MQVAELDEFKKFSVQKVLSQAVITWRPICCWLHGNTNMGDPGNEERGEWTEGCG